MDASGILRAAACEEGRLLRKLVAVRAVIRTYKAPTAQLIRRPTRSPSPKTVEIRGLLAARLQGLDRPTPISELLRFLNNAGVVVGGRKPTQTLSALLSHADEFKPIGRLGWVYTGDSTDADER